MLITGAGEIPPSGFDRLGTMKDDERLPEASTCSLTLTLSHTYQTIVNLSVKWTFQSSMDIRV